MALERLNHRRLWLREFRLLCAGRRASVLLIHEQDLDERVAAGFTHHKEDANSSRTATVLTAQVVMAPIALLAGRLCDSWGRKPGMAIAFGVLPLRIASYALVGTSSALVWLQGLDGLGAGIYGVAVQAIGAD